MAIKSTDNNKLREILYQLGESEYPEYVFQWFFKFFAGGPKEISRSPLYIMENFEALIQAAQIMLDHKYQQNEYQKIIQDTRTPHYDYYFVGDTHGSIQDTYIIIDYLVKVFQVQPFTKVIFLGDIVDRNPMDMENLAFILSFWLLFPNNVFIIRGNHEDSSVCSRYGFSQHLYERIGERQKFQKLWDRINTFFTKLPLGIRVTTGTKELIAFHGGIPFNLEDYAPVNLSTVQDQLNCFHQEHFDMDPLSQTILWSDPDPVGLKEQIVAPSPRTGRPRFSEKALDDFLTLNSLDAVIRGHQKFSMGYNLLWNNKIISLFSTSTYDNQPIGQAKFLHLRPQTALDEIEDEQRGMGIGILEVDPSFLESHLKKYYHAETTQ